MPPRYITSLQSAIHENFAVEGHSLKTDHIFISMSDKALAFAVLLDLHLRVPMNTRRRETNSLRKALTSLKPCRLVKI